VIWSVFFRYGLPSRVFAIAHKLRHPSHRLDWRSDVSEACPGDIVCDTCSTLFWCRAQETEIEEGVVDSILNKIDDKTKTKDEPCCK
jgi:hypothetical protein